ncbi:MAG: ATP synthase F1 subunit delta [Bacteroides sp.]|jgi:F-type H+-transporting ATPase subunit delta|nr:ATP synthase F1 subunit delta [Bacteroides sp.]
MLSKNLRVSKRYARALLSLALENNILEEAYQDMSLISQAFSYEKELKVVLKSPIIREVKKQNILRKLFGEKVHPLILQYILIIARKRRAALLDGISRQFIEEYKAHLNIEPVRVTTAFPLDASMREKALDVAKRFTNKTIEFKEKVDPGIIGGFILDLGDRRYDASIKRRLSDLKKHLNVD